MGELKSDRFEPLPKNPPISKVFREIGFADELGSGMRNTNKYTKLYSGGTPSFDEGDVFKITIPLKNIATAKVGPNSENVGQDVSQDVGQDVGQDEAELQELIIKLVHENSKVTKKEIAKVASVSEKTVERQMKKMTNLKYVGRGYSGHWEIISNEGYNEKHNK